MRVLEATERSSIDIPIDELLGSNGRLKIRPDLIGKGLVELRQSRNALSLRINGLVGRLPITDRLALDVQPKFPIANLNRIVSLSRVRLANPFNNDRPYAERVDHDFLPVPLVRSFSRSLRELIEQGLLREYLRSVTVGSPKPKINFIKSYQKYWSRLEPTKAVLERFDFSPDNPSNQCLKLAATKALALAKTTQQLHECVPVLAECLRQLDRVAMGKTNATYGELELIRRRVPAFRADYAQALHFGNEIIRHTNLSLDTAREGVELESFIISLDEVFERYVRNVLAQIPVRDGFTIATVDGNLKQHQRPLFSDNRKYSVKPDLIMKTRDGIFMIGDVKYKSKPQEEDRYQIISHALSYGVKNAVLIYPRRGAKDVPGLLRLGRIGSPGVSLELHEYHFDLENELEAEEQALREMVSSIYKLESAQTNA